MTTSDAQWFDLTPDHGVLELHEHLTAGVGLELHVVLCGDGIGTFAWWVTDDGGWMGVAEVGVG